MTRNVGTFSENIQEHLRISGYSQQELAKALGLHPKVLSRKLNGSGNARLTHLEIQRIITELANLHAITTRDEVFTLLELAQVEPGILSEEEWQKPPLSLLAEKRTTPLSSTYQDLVPTPPRHNLPAQTTRLIGREWALERLKKLLKRDGVRLITLTGTGGTGKTRLAIAVASEMVDSFAHGVWFVSLAGVNDPSQVPLTIMQVFNLTSSASNPPLQSLTTYLQNRHLLLVLDNFEHVRDAAAVLDEMLAAAPELKILITSRGVLHLYGEHEFSVPPLDTPDLSIALDSTTLSYFAAAQLFIERAQAVQPYFTVTEENTLIIAQICARLDGLPLALELAAARIRVLSPRQLLERITPTRLPLLTKGAKNLPSRQQTLTNTIKWSYDLLSAEEQTWFNRLGVFSGGWSLRAAEAMLQNVIAEKGEETSFDSMLDILEQLLDNSLIIQLPDIDGQARFSMLETLREYALEQLQARGEFERFHDWHACYYLRKAEAAELGMRTPQQLLWLVRLTADRENFRTAMEWSLQQAREGKNITSFPCLFLPEFKTGKIVASSRILSKKGIIGERLQAVELCLRLAAAFRPYWEWQGYLTDARNWLSAALELPLAEDAGETVLAARAKALSEYSRLMTLQNDQTRATELAEESCALWQHLDDPEGFATALIHRSWAAYGVSDYETARNVCQEGLQLISDRDDPWLHAQLLFYLASATGFLGDFEQMRAFYTRSKELFELVGDKSALADLLKDQGAMLMLEQQYDGAVDCLVKSIQLCYKMNHKQFITTGICWLSIAVGMRGEPDQTQASLQAAQLNGAAEGLMETIGLKSWSKTHPFIQAVQEYIRSQVDEASWNRAWAEGHAFTLEQAIELVCRQAKQPHSDG